MSRAENRILCEMCQSRYPQPTDIIKFVEDHPAAASSKDWYGFLPIQYLAMNPKINSVQLTEIMSKAPPIKAEYE